MYWERDLSTGTIIRTLYLWLCLSRFSPLIQDPSSLFAVETTEEEISSPVAMLYTMATCHSLKLVSDELIGDPLDAKMFEFTNWTFQEGGRIYEFIEHEEDKEGEDVDLMERQTRPQGGYHARDASDRGPLPSVRPPTFENKVRAPCPSNGNNRMAWSFSYSVYLNLKAQREE